MFSYNGKLKKSIYIFFLKLKRFCFSFLESSRAFCRM